MSVYRFKGQDGRFADLEIDDAQLPPLSEALAARGFERVTRAGAPPLMSSSEVMALFAPQYDDVPIGPDARGGYSAVSGPGDVRIRGAAAPF